MVKNFQSHSAFCEVMCNSIMTPFLVHSRQWSSYLCLPSAILSMAVEKARRRWINTDCRWLGIRLYARVRTDIKMLLSRTFLDLQRPNSRVFQDSKILFSRTFQDLFHSQTWVAWGRIVHTEMQYLRLYYCTPMNSNLSSMFKCITCNSLLLSDHSNQN